MSAEAVGASLLKGNKTVSDIAKSFGKSERTIYRILTHRPPISLSPKPPRSVVVLMDTTYWGRNFGVVIMKDSIVGDVLWYKFINRKESIADYREGIDWLVDRGFSIRGIVSDGLKGLRKALSEYKYQYCQFHQVMTIRTKLTRNPKLEASKELLELSRMLCHTDKESFIGAFQEWEDRWMGFLKERTTDSNGKSYYTHKELRSAWLSLKRNMPWLWTWYDYPELKIPNTNNAMEALNSDLKTKLALHRGMGLERRKVFIKDFLNAHSPHK